MIIIIILIFLFITGIYRTYTLYSYLKNYFKEITQIGSAIRVIIEDMKYTGA